MTQNVNGARRNLPHPTRQALIDELRNVEESCEQLSFLATAEVFKMEKLPRKTLPDVDAYHVMAGVHADLTDALARMRDTLILAGVIPPPLKEGLHDRSPMR